MGVVGQSVGPLVGRPVGRSFSRSDGRPVCDLAFSAHIFSVKCVSSRIAKDDMTSVTEVSRHSVVVYRYTSSLDISTAYTLGRDISRRRRGANQMLGGNAS